MIDERREAGSSDVAALARVVGHEIGEITALLDGYMGLVVESAAANGVVGVRGTIEHLRELYDDLLSLTRLAATPPERAVIDPAAALDVARRRLCDPAGVSNVEIQVHPLPSVIADPRELEQLFVHVLRSATGSNGRRALVVAGSRRGPDVRLDITANGGGRGRRRSSPPGRAVVLELGRHIAVRNGGRLWVEGNHRRGTRISLELPAAEP